MKTTKTKIKPEVEEVIKTTQKKIKTTGKYDITIGMNGETYSCITDNVKEYILSLKPELLFSEIYVTIKTTEDIIERKLNLIQGKRLFSDEMNMDIFINNLFLE